MDTQSISTVQEMANILASRIFDGDDIRVIIVQDPGQETITSMWEMDIYDGAQKVGRLKATPGATMWWVARSTSESEIPVWNKVDIGKLKKTAMKSFSSLNNEEEIINWIRYKIKNKEKITTDDIQDLYAKSKELRSNKLELIARKLSSNIKEDLSLMLNEHKSKSIIKMKTKLMEALVRQCVREVLDQVDERVDSDGKPIDKSSGIGKGNKPKKIKVTWLKPTKFNPSVKQGAIKEEDQTKQDDPKDKPVEPSAVTSQPEAEPSTPEPSQTPAGPSAAEKPEPSAPPAEEPSQQPKKEPEAPGEPQKTVNGAVLINPRDKSKEESINYLQGQSDANIERYLHQIAVKNAGSHAKVSIGAKRLAREVSHNPSTPAFFYFGKMDPESDEVFLMADKSRQIAKDESVQPSEITGPSITTLPPSYKSFGAMNDDEYEHYMKGRRFATPRYGIDEGAKKIIKSVVNRILDGKR